MNGDETGEPNRLFRNDLIRRDGGRGKLTFTERSCFVLTEEGIACGDCLTDTLERDDTVTKLYNKSLLYLVSNAFERIPEKPIFGMQKFNKAISHQHLSQIYTGTQNTAKTRSRTHGGFDNDVNTMNSLLKTVLGEAPKRPFQKSDLDY